MLKRMMIGGALAASLLFAGCGKADEALKELESIKSDACACKNTDCTNKVQAKIDDWMKKHADTKGTQSQADKAQKLMSDISECLVKAMGAEEGGSGGSADK